MAATVAQKVFFAHLFETSGMLGKVNGALVFVGDDDTLVTVEPRMVHHLVVLGEVTLAEAQRVEDLMLGGYAAIACSREEGRA